MRSTDIAIIMCAGKGTRMQSPIAKVLHEINGHSMINRVISNVIGAGIKRIIIMVGDNENEIKEHLKDHFMFSEMIFIKQNNPQGTGHCIQCAMPCLEKYCENLEDRIAILSGDMPFISSESILQLLHFQNSILVACKENPFGFGRVLTEYSEVLRIIEEKDCTEKERLIDTVNCGAYCFTYSMLSNAIFKIDDNNANHEYYLPDVIKHKNCYVTSVYLSCEKSHEALGVNTQEDLQLTIEKDTLHNLTNIINKKMFDHHCEQWKCTEIMYTTKIKHQK
jgi:bifunctional UDP-N-acetylglucosamine pyrophosphorylase/glucosamine-1-phosphate N-acetyltransferase